MRGFKLCAWPILIVAVVLAAASVYYTYTHLTIRTSRNDLVASNQRLIQESEKMDKAFGGRDGMVVVVENGHPRRAIKFANDLATELRRYPEHFPELFYHINPESFKPSALLYLDVKDLTKIKDNLLGQQNLLTGLAANPRLLTFYQSVNDQMARAMIGELFTGFLDEKEKKELPDVSLLNASLRGLAASLESKKPGDSMFSSFFPKDLKDLEDAGYFFTENDKFLLFLVTPKGSAYASRSLDLALLREVVQRVQTRYPGLQAGVTGPDALEADEMGSSMKDITLATWLSLVGQMALLIIFFRSLRRTLVEGFVLILGLCWTFGLVTLVVGHLNLLSLIFVVRKHHRQEPLAAGEDLPEGGEHRRNDRLERAVPLAIEQAVQPLQRLQPSPQNQDLVAHTRSSSTPERPEVTARPRSSPRPSARRRSRSRPSRARGRRRWPPDCRPDRTAATRCCCRPRPPFPPRGTPAGPRRRTPGRRPTGQQRSTCSESRKSPSPDWALPPPAAARAGPATPRSARSGPCSRRDRSR